MCKNFKTNSAEILAETTEILNGKSVFILDFFKKCSFSYQGLRYTKDYTVWEFYGNTSEKEKFLKEIFSQEFVSQAYLKRKNQLRESSPQIKNEKVHEKFIKFIDKNKLLSEDKKTKGIYEELFSFVLEIEKNSSIPVNEFHYNRNDPAKIYAGIRSAYNKKVPHQNILRIQKDKFVKNK